MDVFITWSGARSLRVAQAVRDWLRHSVQTSRPWLSEDIEKGDRWNEAIRLKLAASHLGIICLTQDNLRAPWIHFEAGALAKDGMARVCVLLCGVLPADIPQPLSQFQATRLEKEDMAALAKSLSAALNRAGHQTASDDVVGDASNNAWVRLEAAARDALTPSSSPALQYPIGGASPYDGTLYGVSPETLDRYHASARRHLDFLGHSLTGLFENRGGTTGMVKALLAGATVRVIFLDPSTPASDQLLQVSRAAKTDLVRKINRSLDAALEFKASLRTHVRRLGANIDDASVDALQGKLQLATSRLISYVHLQRVDDAMLVSHYSQSEQPGQRAPTQEFLSTDRFFTFYLDEFERIWHEASPVEELRTSTGLIADRTRVVRHLPVLRQVYRKLVVGGDDEPLPPPRMLVVLPHMACTLHCANCFTWNAERMKGGSMSIELFKSILQQARDIGVTCLELTGGGEPLEHPKAVQLLQLAGEARSATLRVGVLTNASRIAAPRHDAVLEGLMSVDYVRLGWTEQHDADPASSQPQFVSSLLALGERRAQRRSTVRIGVKLLLTEKNLGQVVNMADALLRIETRAGDPIVDHVKVKSIRGKPGVEPSAASIRAFEHAMVALKSRAGTRAADVQIDVKSARVDGAYRCWISPIMTVIDAYGVAYLCCNFYERPEASKLGSLGPSGERRLMDFWGGPQHLRAIRDLHVDSVCNSALGCHCRLVHYQRHVEPILALDPEAVVPVPAIFHGHESML